MIYLHIYIRVYIHIYICLYIYIYTIQYYNMHISPGMMGNIWLVFFLNDLMVRRYWTDGECKGKLSHCRPHFSGFSGKVEEYRNQTPA